MDIDTILQSLPIKNITNSTYHNSAKMDIWSWICELPDSRQWPPPTLSESSSDHNSTLVLPLATSKPTTTNVSNSIQLRAEKSSSSSSVNFSVCSLVIDTDDNSSTAADPTNIISSSNNITTHWVSETCNLNSEKPFLPLVLQLLEEIISRSPNSHESTTCPRSQLQKLKSEPISWIMDSHSSESFSSFFNLIFLTRLFWICACDASSEVGSLYFHSLLLSPNTITSLETRHSPVLRTFFISVGTDVELCFMRTFGYMLAKCLILKEVTSSRRPAAEAAVGLKSISVPPSSPSGFSYAMESHGLWILKGYAPVKAMKCVWTSSSDRPQKISRISGGGGSINFFPGIEEARETVVKYVLGHQQLEAVIQMEYTVRYYDGYIHVHAHVDNIRLHVVKLGFKKNKEMQEYGLLDERYFPSRVRVWVGPEIGANYLSGLSLGRATDNMEKEVEVDKTLKSEYSYHGGKSPPSPPSKTAPAPATKAVATARMATKTKTKNWRCDQDVEGNAAIFDAVLCDNTTGNEIYAGAGTWTLPNGTGGDGNAGTTTTTVTNNSNNRAFTKSGGVIFSCGSDGEWKDGVGWRLNKEMEGSVLKWRIGGQVWVSYWPNHVKSSLKETRFVEWCDEVDLPLIASM